MMAFITATAMMAVYGCAYLMYRVNKQLISMLLPYRSENLWYNLGMLLLWLETWALFAVLGSQGA